MLRALLLTLAIFLSTTWRAGAQCDALARLGLYDFSLTHTDERGLIALTNWLSSQRSTDFQKVSGGGISAGIPIGDIPVALNLEGSQSGWDRTTEQGSQYSTERREHSAQFYQALRQINPGVVAAWQACMTQGGLHVWLETLSASDFYVAARFTSTGTQTSTSFDHFSSQGATCDGQLTDSATISGSTRRTLCKRPSGPCPVGPVTIVINAKDDPIGGGTLHFAERPCPAVSAPRREIRYTESWHAVAGAHHEYPVRDDCDLTITSVEWMGSGGPFQIQGRGVPGTIKQYFANAGANGRWTELRITVARGTTIDYQMQQSSADVTVAGHYAGCEP
jgi:hypothetical protein